MKGLIFLSISFLITTTIKAEIILTCDYTLTPSLLNNPTEKYSCKVQSNGNLASEKMDVVFDGTHKDPIRGDVHVKMFIMDGFKVQFIPSGIKKRFQSLEEFIIRNANLKEVTKDDLTVHTKLKLLDLSHNNLTHLFNVFNVDTLENINLSHNQINELDQNLFNQCMELRELNLSHNFLTTIHRKLFYHNQELKSVDLSHNAIAVIQEDTFSRTPIIESIFLHENPLRDSWKAFNLEPLKKLQITNEPWSCDKNTLSSVTKYIQQVSEAPPVTSKPIGKLTTKQPVMEGGFDITNIQEFIKNYCNLIVLVMFVVILLQLALNIGLCAMKKKEPPRKIEIDENALINTLRRAKVDTRCDTMACDALLNALREAEEDNNEHCVQIETNER